MMFSHRVISSAEVLRYLLISCILPLLALRCTWGDSSFDPPPATVKLDLISTYPAGAAVGPFDLYLPRPDSTRPHFVVTFNKPVDLFSLDSSTVRCTGFDFPVIARVLSHTLTSTSDAVGFQVVPKNVPLASLTPLTYGINRTYTVTVESTITDKQGNMLGKKIVFSFTPEPYFRIARINVVENRAGIPAAVTAYFNARVSPGIFSSVSLSPPLPVAPVINGTDDSASVTWNVAGEMEPSTVYAVDIAGTATDAAGDPIHAGMQRSIPTPPLEIAHNTINTVGAHLSTQVTYSFNYPMDVTSLNAAFSFSPPTALTQSVTEEQFSVWAANDFLPSTDYTAVLSADAMTRSGHHIAAPITISFRTAEFAMSHSPASGAGQVSTHSVLELDYTGAIVTPTVPTAISVYPPISGRVTFGSSSLGKYNVAYFVPNGLWSPGTHYTVIVANTVQSIGGFYCARPDTFSFTTGY